MNEDKIKKDLEDIETINIELDHRVSMLIAKNGHLKQTYKQLYDSMYTQSRVKPSTSASGSQPSGNTKKDKIRQTPSSTQKNKVEAHHRKVKSSLKNKDCVVAPKGTATVQHSKLNANSELKCVKYGMDGPEDELEKVFWKYLKNMFEEPLSTDPIWSELGQQRIISWRYYESCRVHCLNLESMDIYMLIERTYPLSAEMCKAMLDKKLQGGKPDENCYKMLKMMEKQAGIRK
ncbi:hypothetical protein Tco_1518023 [Tanacetum coccineum]